MRIIKYDTNIYKFQELLLDLYQVSDLSTLHTQLTEENGVKGIGHDTHSILHNKFYEKLNSGWNEIREAYERFVSEVIINLSAEKSFLYQSFPSYRIQFPNNKAVSTWHHDSDALHLHPDGEINFIIPITNAFDTNTVWVESAPGLGDFGPVNMKYGDCLIFDGNKCNHGNKVNETGATRISFDFRILPLSKYDPTYSAVTATKKNRFIIGEYYSLLGDLNE